MSRLYVEIVRGRSSSAYYDFLAVSNPLTTLSAPLPLIRHLSTSLFRFPVPPRSGANFITVSAEQICEIPNCYRSALESTLEVSVLLFTPEGTSKLRRDSIK